MRTKIIVAGVTLAICGILLTIVAAWSGITWYQKIHDLLRGYAEPDVFKMIQAYHARLILSCVFAGLTSCAMVGSICLLLGWHPKSNGD